MTERRPLIEGLKERPPAPADQAKERGFVYGQQETVARPASPTPGRTPVSTRIRGDIAAALKRASLDRQLRGVEPNTLQDILEEALTPWLRSNGYLP